MNEITIPYHLAIPSIICIVGLLAILFYRNKLFKKNRTFWTAVTVFLVFYLFIVGGATYDDIYYQYEANRLDLNKDGLFSTDEQTAELNEVMKNLTNDVGRNFSFITGFIFAFIISGIVYIFGRLFFNSKSERQDK
ncbi:hypothetical protein [Parafilimonas sp.]|uniref:hypothetical protein n=1 Tax=Parafilimonas sp. TaxID=1969739 RepID=UPI0039E556F8